jgi:phosphonate transport system permease protein
MNEARAAGLKRRQETDGAIDGAAWKLGAPYGYRSLLLVIAMAAILFVSARRVEFDRMLSLTGEAMASAVGLQETSQVGRGLSRVARDLFPIVIAERTEVGRIANFDPANIPPFSHIETREIREFAMNPATLKLEEKVTIRKFLVEPAGYLLKVLSKTVETVEIALWATNLAVLISLPLAYFGASNYTPNRVAYAASRGLVSLLRAIPELISALFLVLAYGFGPVAGFLALGLHGAGFLGKFYAEDIEGADRKPQDALRALGASRIRVLRLAVLPQVLPNYIAYTLYILDRNVRMATVIGIVGAGGVGQELKGRYDMFQYGHVGTILVVIFVTVFVLDQISARIRARLIG